MYMLTYLELVKIQQAQVLNIACGHYLERMSLQYLPLQVVPMLYYVYNRSAVPNLFFFQRGPFFTFYFNCECSAAPFPIFYDPPGITKSFTAPTGNADSSLGITAQVMIIINSQSKYLPIFNIDQDVCYEAGVPLGTHVLYEYLYYLPIFYVLGSIQTLLLARYLGTLWYLLLAIQTKIEESSGEV